MFSLVPSAARCFRRRSSQRRIWLRLIAAILRDLLDVVSPIRYFYVSMLVCVFTKYNWPTLICPGGDNWCLRRLSSELSITVHFTYTYSASDRRQVQLINTAEDERYESIIQPVLQMFQLIQSGNNDDYLCVIRKLV